MERMELAIGRLLLIGVLIALSLSALGAALYLFKQGNESVNYHTFHGISQQLTSIRGIWQSAMQMSAAGLIQLGLLVLVLVQILRVLLTTWFFVLLRDRIFVAISLFILGTLIYSFFCCF